MTRPETTERDAILACLPVSKLFKGIDPEIYAPIVSTATIKTIKEGEYLWTQGDSSELCTIIKRGVVFIRRVNSVRSNILGLFGPHESVGLVATLNSIPFPASAIALTNEVQVVQFQSHLFMDLVAAHSILQTNVNRVLLDFNNALREKIDILAAGGVNARITSLLRFLAERFGDTHDDQTIMLPLVITRAQIAALVDARIETVIRIMSQWQKDNKIVSTNDSIVIYEWPET